MEKDKTIAWSMKAKESFKTKVTRVAQAIDLTASQLVRSATTEKINQLAKDNPKVAQILQEEDSKAA